MSTSEYDRGYRAGFEAGLRQRSPKKRAATNGKELSSKSFKGLRLIRRTVCDDGHTFNGAGCRVCPFCTTLRHARVYEERIRLALMS